MSRNINKHNFNPIQQGDIAKDENILPIKRRADRLAFKKYWLNSKSKYGLRNWVIFCLGIVTGLRASDLVRLEWKQVYKPNGKPRRLIVGEKDKKTGKVNRFLDIQPLHNLLIKYNQWLSKNYRSKWLFYKATQKNNHITSHYLYVIMRRAGDKLGFEHIGSHSLRKSMGYIAYQRTGDILYVMRKLRQSDPRITLDYINCSAESMNHKTEQIWRGDEF